MSTSRGSRACQTAAAGARGASELRHDGGGGGMLCLHVAVDDMSRACYAELLGDERKETCLGFVRRARDWLRSLGVEVEGVMTDNGPGYRSRALNDWLAAVGIRHVYTRPYSPWQNGKVERTSRTLAREWQYSRAYGSEEERAEALSSYLEYYNHDRPHSACGGLSPMSRLCQQPVGSEQLGRRPHPSRPPTRGHERWAAGDRAGRDAGGARCHLRWLGAAHSAPP